MTNYLEAFRAKQALAKASFTVSDYFPVVGEVIQLTNLSKDSDSNLWTINNGLDAPRQSSSLNESTVISSPGAVKQTLSVNNTVSTGEISTETVYGLDEPSEPYFIPSALSPVCRVGEINTITVNSKYNFTGVYSIRVEVIDAKDDSLFYFQDNVTEPINIVFTYRGSFNVRVIAVSDGIITENKQYRLISVTPALQPIENAYKLELKNTNEVYLGFTEQANSLDGIEANLKPGDTVVISLPANRLPEDTFRLRFVNVKGSLENPITITVNEAVPMVMEYTSWWGVITEQCEHVIFDGRGYQNKPLTWKLKKHSSSESGECALQITSLTNYIEVHSMEISHAKFAGIFAKTDPDVNKPATLRANFTMQDTLLHNCYIHDTRGEGIYFGYFDASVHTKKNNAGVEITYRPHNLNDTKIYRNIFLNSGWDGLQLNNATGKTEIHDNYLKNSAVFGEPNQNTGMSLTLEGKIFNNVIDGVQGLGVQAGALGPLDIFNNIIFNIAEGSYALSLLNGKDVPEQFGIDGNNTIPYRVFNNTLLTTGIRNVVGAANVCQYLGFLFRNNITSTSNLYGGQAQSTMDLWAANASNNVVLDLKNLDNYKFGSFNKGEFNLYPDSPLVSGGSLMGEQYDIRGYKNWSNADKFVGAHAGIVRLSSNILTLEKIDINNGSTRTDSRNITIVPTFIGNPTHYMVSESNTFTSAVWIEYSGATIPFQLSSDQAIKTVYFKLKNSVVETPLKSDTIEYTSSRKFLVDFNSIAGYVTAPTFNRFISTGNTGTSPIPAGYQLANLKDTTLVSSALTLTVVDPFAGIESHATTGLPYPYPYETIRFSWLKTAGSGKGSLNLSGCDNTKKYDILLYAHRTNAQQQHFSVNDVDQVFIPNHGTSQPNYANQSVYNDVVPVNGIITIAVKTIGTQPAFLGVAEIIEKNV